MMRHLLLCCLIAFSALAVNARQTYTIRTAAGAYTPEWNGGMLPQSEWERIPSYKGYKYVLIQFEDLPSAAITETLKQRDIILLTYLPQHTYYARVPAAFDAQRFGALHIGAVFAPAPQQKIHRKIQDNQVPDYAWAAPYYKIMLTLQPQVMAEEILETLHGFNATVYTVYNHQHIALGILPSQINAVAALPAVQFVDFINAPMEQDNLRNKTDHRSNNLNTDYGAGRHYDGSSVRVALTDDGLIGPHIDYQGRTTQYAVTSINNGNHGDHCAGIIMGAGNRDPIGRGMAPGCDLWVYEATSTNNYILDDTLYTSPFTSIDVVSTSYSDGCNVGYNAGAESADRQIHTFKNVMRVFSAGNNGTSNCSYGAGAGWGNITGGIKMAKNLITVANLTYTDQLASSSSRGPAYDGRIKPDLSAVGTDVYSTVDSDTYEYKTGTSMSCPGVSGVFTQLYQAYRSLNSGADPNTGLLKAILMNTCDDIGNPGPDFKHGYGRINALRAVKLLETVQYMTDSVSTAASKTFTINVPANTQRVKIMLYWTDPEAAVSATTALVNDLDLVVKDPAATNFLPWVLDPTPVAANLNANAVRAADHLNNAEQVTIDNPVAGTYTVTVNGYAVPLGPQEFHINYEIMANDALELTYPLGGEGLEPGDTASIRWDAIANGQTFSLDYSTDNGASWNPITGSIAATQNYYDWIVPTAMSGQCRIRVNRGSATSGSPASFSIIKVPDNLAVQRVCPDTITIKWSAVAGADAYQVFMLGNTYMDSIATTTDTFYHFTGLQIMDEHWFSVKSVKNANGAVSRRAYAVKQATGLLNCVLQQDAEAVSSSSPGNLTLQNCMSNPALTVNITAKNSGLNTINGLPFTYQLNGLGPVNETSTGTIAPGATTNFTFAVPLSGITNGTNTLKIWTALAGDLYHLNDTLVYTINQSGSGVMSFPWTEDFESNALCAGIAACDYTSCPLANGMINEANGLIDQFDWKVNDGPTPTTTTGPDVDHTLGTATGKYIYTEASYCFTQTALLQTPCFTFSPTSKPYLSFWYHLYGTDMGELHVDANVNGVWQNDIMTAISGDQGNAWKKQTINLSAFNGKTVIFRFRGITGGGSRSDMALDDLSVVDSAAALGVTDLKSGFMVYPNPVSQYVEIGAMQGQTAFDAIAMYNALGECVFSQHFADRQSHQRADLSSLPAGLYSLVIHDGDRVVYRNKLLKQ